MDTQRFGYLTPDDLPETLLCLTLSIPYNHIFIAAVLGALYELTSPGNWQVFGDITPDDAAYAALDMIDVATNFDGSCAPADVDAPFWDDSSGDDASDTSPADDQDWYGVWDGETFVEALSYWAVTAFLATGISSGAAIKFITPLRTFRLTLKKNPHGAKLLVFMDSNIFQLIDLFGPSDEVVTLDVVSPGSTLMLVHSGEHNVDATPDADGNYVVDIIKSQLSEGDVLPPNIRYVGSPPVFQTFDGADWVATPSSDPRYNSAGLLPPMAHYSGLECDVAARMTAQLKDTLDIFIATGDAAQFATQVLALLVFPFGLAGWLLDLLLLVANVLIDIGQANIEAAFTSTVYDDIKCEFECFIGTDGRITQAGLDSAYDAIVAAHPGTVANVIGELRFLYTDVPMINAGVSRSETGDCSGCPSCAWYVEYDFSLGAQGWEVLSDPANGARGGFVGDHFVGTKNGGQIQLFLQKHWIGITLTGVAYYGSTFHGTGIGNLRRELDLPTWANPPSGAVQKSSGALPTVTNAWSSATHAAWTTTNGYGTDWDGDGNGTGNVSIYKLRFSGTGTPPTDGTRVGSLIP